MDIACPTCKTIYEIDDGSLAEAGRKVRCAECTTVWRVYRGGRFDLLSVPAPAVPAEEASPAQAPLMEAPPLVPSEADIAATADFPAASAELGSGEAPAGPDPAAMTEPTAQRGKAKITSGRKPGGKTGAGGAWRQLIGMKTLALTGAIAMIGGAIMLRERVVLHVPQSAAVFSAIGLPVNLRGIEIRGVRSRMVDDNGVNVLVIDGDLVNLKATQVTVPRLRFAVIGDKGQELYVWSAQADRSSLKAGETLNFRRRLAAPPSDGRDVSVRFLNVSDITAGLR